MKKRLRIFGARVRASMVVDAVFWHFSDEIEIDGYYEDRPPAGGIGPGGHPVLGTVADGLAQLPGSGCCAFIAMGTRASARACETFLKLQESGVEVVSLISPRAHISPSARIGQNAFVFPGVFVGCQAEIGHLLCAHAGAVIEHHCRVGHNVLVASGAMLAGFVKIGSHSFIGSGSTLVPEVEVGSGTLLGAGSLVTRNIPASVIAFGQPAVAVREVRSGDEVPLAQDVVRLASLGLG